MKKQYISKKSIKPAMQLQEENLTKIFSENKRWAKTKFRTESNKPQKMIKQRLDNKDIT